MKELVWPVATYGCESLTLIKNEERRLDAFEMKGLKKILPVSPIAKKTNKWCNQQSWSKETTIKDCQSLEASILRSGHTMRKQGSCLEKVIMQGTMPGAHMRGRPHIAWKDTKTWTGLTMEESIKTAENRDKWRKYVHGVANPWIEEC